ncbi:hypothetical protein Smp_013050 [Schistosoma mansoni]|uniref:TLDc domain-containing protein n=1 Tax=Schistosoma mansoni TaxID=6183 RepID=G4VEV9_SCHMA|nr:hypothetical protein Smp_013050 [Schistosoma mansoni]|eukprot:XP_018651078.1 hypothetical protein Smp_013050 [Schistosoma mansoni]
MGGTNSRIETNLNPVKTYTGFEDHDNEQVISKESFRNKFDFCLYDLADLLWDNFADDRNSNDEFMVLKKYQSIIEYLSSAQDKLEVFLSLFKLRVLSESDVKALFRWFLLGRDLKPDMWQLIFTSILSSDENGIYKHDTIVSCLNRLCPDICNDLVNILLQLLNDNHSFNLTDFNPYTLSGTILTSDLQWLFSTFLTYPYKRAPKTCLLQTIPLECEQLSHLHCLYDSTNHGMSLTRLLELVFDYNGPMIVFLKAKEFLFCLLSDQGLKESLKTFGKEYSFLYQIQPKFIRLVSGKLGTDSGIIYANFSTKTSKRGLLVGHQPLISPVIEINEDFTELKYNSGLSIRLNAIEVWAAGSSDHMSKLEDQKKWESDQVAKAKERKLKNETWQDSADRFLLELDGKRVRHSDEIEPP